MLHSVLKLASILVLAKIGCLDSRAVEIVYSGTGCECAKQLPLQVHVPVVPPPKEPECLSHGYKVEVPTQARAKYSYSFDFVVEEPIPPPPPPCSAAQNLFAAIDKIVLRKPDCIETLPPPPPPPPAPPVVKACDKTKFCTCGLCKAMKLPLDFDYEVDVPVVAKTCTCGQCSPSKPAKCRYVFSDIQTNQISRNTNGRSKRDITSKKQQHIRDYVKSLKAALDARKTQKSRLTKRDIKGEFDLLQKDQANLDLTIPEVIQYMPETLMPNYKRGKCNIGCQNFLSKHMQELAENTNNTPSPTELSDAQKDRETQETDAQTQAEALADAHIQQIDDNQPTFFNQHFVSMLPYGSTSYPKRSINPYQCPCHPAIMPPPYIPNPHMATVAQNPGNPIWYQPRPLIDPNGEYVYDRLGHKYEVKNGSLKLVTPSNSDDVNVSAPAASTSDNTNDNAQAEATASTAAAEQAQSEVRAPVLTEPQMLQSPVVGAQSYPDPSYDPHMDKVIRDIIYRHPDFVEASQHAPGSLTQPQDVQRAETMQFLAKLIRGRLSNWFGGAEDTSNQNYQDLNRYSSETGASIKFIPVVTVDKDKLTKYRQEKGMPMD